MLLMYYMLWRPTEVLQLKIENIKEERLLVELTKTRHSVGKKLIKWNPSLKSVVEELVARNKNKIKNTGYLLCKADGTPYTHYAFSSLWRAI